MTITMIALKPLKYAGARVAKGGKFEVRGQSDARLLAAIGHAKRAVPVAHVPVPAKPLPAASLKKTVVASVAEVIAEAIVPPESMPAAGDVVEANHEEQVEAAAADDAGDAPAESAEPSEQPADAADLSPRTGKPKRHYRRRDMTGEG